MSNLFVSYLSILERHGLAWLLERNQKVAVDHVLSAIRTVSLKTLLKSDLDFDQQSLQKAFTGFMRYAIKLAEKFQLVDNGKLPSGNSDKNSKRSGNNQKSNSNHKKRTTKVPTTRLTNRIRKIKTRAIVMFASFVS